MSKEGKKVDFDLSTLSLEELIKTYDSIDEFLKFLDEKTIVQEEEAKKKDE